MGQITLPKAGTVYVDTSTIIYFVEKIEPYYSASAPLWSALDAGTQPILTSELSLLEVLVKPLREANHTLIALYRDVLLWTRGLDCEPISRATLESAARIRATHNLKTPDAIHAASALETRCALLVTNDPAFRRVVGLPVAVLDEVINS